MKRTIRWSLYALLLALPLWGGYHLQRAWVRYMADTSALTERIEALENAARTPVFNARRRGR